MPEPEGVVEQVGLVDGLELILVEQESHMRIWIELMIDEHPQGARPLVGRQIRYLVSSAHGFLRTFRFARPRCNWLPGTFGLDGTPNSGALSCMVW